MIIPLINRAYARKLGPHKSYPAQITPICTADRVLFYMSVHGGWGQWGDWGACSLTCGKGSSTRDRHCDSPNTEYGGDDCTGNDNEIHPCLISECKGMHGVLLMNT